MQKVIVPLLLIPFLLFNSCKDTDNREGREGNIDNEILTSRISAHRGGKGIDGYTENCLLTMQYLNDKYPEMMYEIDLQMTRDNKIVLFHDDGLDRLTGTSGRIDEMDYNRLRKLSLIDRDGDKTDCGIPLLKEVLQWADDAEVTLWIDFKPSVSYERVISMINNRNAADNVVLIAYTIPQAKKLDYLAREMMLSVPARNMEEWNRLLKTEINLDKVVAFTGTILSDAELLNAIHEKNVKTMLGTLGNLDNKASANGDALYGKWLNDGYDLFSTDRPEAVWRAIH